MYKDQVSLLLSVVTEAVSDERIALKGGTAINLFIENMPRLSVDIDLCYLPIQPREKALKSIDNIMRATGAELSKEPGVLTQINKTTEGMAKQVLVQKGRSSVKIEINYVLRGCVYDPKILPLCQNAQDIFKTYTEVRCLSIEDIYAGKFCAALDRQHPRDLYDVMVFFLKNKFTEKLKKAFLVYLISGNRPISEMIQPTLLDQRELYENEFKGMTDSPVAYEELEKTRTHLIHQIKDSLTQADNDFLISFKSGEPIWSYFEDLDHIKNMSAVQWKLQNIRKMAPVKHKESLQKLSKKLT
jgi:predicted nucleotidyltransferase component of viral defense system